MRRTVTAAFVRHVLLLWAATLGAPGSTPAQSEEPAGPIEKIEEEIDRLSRRARFGEAASLAREILSLRESDPDAKPYEIVDDEWRVRMLERAADLPVEAREELASVDSLSEICWEHWNKGRYGEGELVARRMLEIEERLLGDGFPEVTRTVGYLANLLRFQGKYADAEELYREIVSRRRRLLGEEHPDLALSLGNLAALLVARGDYAGADPLYREALQMRRRIFGETDAAVAGSLDNLANLLMKEGRYTDAEPLLRRALSLRRSQLGDEDPGVATSLANLARLLQSQGDRARAEPLFREALRIRRKVLGAEHHDTVVSLNQIAFFLKEQGDYEAAEPYYREALALGRDLHGPRHPDVAATRNNLGRLLVAREKYDEAEPLLQEAVEIWREAFGRMHPDVASGLQSLASLYHARGAYETAEPLYLEALEISREFWGEGHPHVSRTLRELGLLYWAMGRDDEAERMLADAARLYDTARLRAGAGLARSTFRLPSPYTELAARRLAVGKVTEAWPAAERGLARSLADLLLTAEQRELGLEEAARGDSLEKQLGALEHRLAAYRGAAARGDTTVDAERLSAETYNGLLACEAEWSAFQQGIADRHPVSEGNAFPLERVQSSLSERTALIGWIDVVAPGVSPESWAFLLRATGPVTWARLTGRADPAGRGSPAQRGRAFRNAAATPSSSENGVARDAADLWIERIEPLLPALEGVEELIVIPSGAMLGVPVETFTDRKGRLLCDRFSVSYVPSATIHAWLTERAIGESGHERRILLVGDPPFNRSHLGASGGGGEDRSDAAAPPSTDPDPGAAMEAALAGDASALTSLPRIPGTREEVTTLARISREATLLLGPDASEQELVRLSDSGRLGRFGTIHFATHALVDDERPERSALVLSQVGLPDPVEAAMRGGRIHDGLITAKEIVREWRLDADLVTLSACETGLGKEVGGEGYIGFAHAFLQAGARSLLVSLWKAEDRATALVMRRFYENRWGAYEGERNGRIGEPMSKAEALQEAKHWLRNCTNGEGRRPYAHPFYWSAFILIGERG